MTDNSNRHQMIFDDKKITIIGTAHVSRESADLVDRVMEEEKPETVCIELCESRYQALTQKNRWQNTNLIKVIKEKKAFLLLSNFLLASFQKKIGEKLGIKPGETTEDGEFSLQLTNCIGACDQAPAMMINDKLYVNLTPRKIVRILKRGK